MAEYLRARLVAALSEAEVWERTARLAVAALTDEDNAPAVLERFYEQAANDALHAEGERRTGEA